MTAPTNDDAVARAGSGSLDDAAEAALRGGDHARAAALAREAVARQGPATRRLVILGWSLIQAGEAPAAVAALEAPATRAAELLVPLGLARYLAGDAANAALTLERATVLVPHDPEGWNALGLARAALGDDARAEAAWRRALVERPRHVPALGNLCDLLLRSARGEEAQALASRAAADDPAHPGLWFKAGHVALERLDLPAARDAFERARMLMPEYVPTHVNLGVVEDSAGDPAAAAAHFRAALAREPGSIDARYGLATALLKRREVDEGWRLYAEAKPGAGPVSRIPAPRWDGQALAGTLLVDADQGLGDVLMFARFATQARARVGRLAVFCDRYFEPAARLLASHPAIDAVLDRASGGQAIAATCSLSDLPRMLGVGERAFEPVAPYLFPPADRVAHWAAKLEGVARPRVGLCWAGSPRPEHADANRMDRRRSMPAAKMAALLQVPGVRFFSLQKGRPGEAAQAFGEALVDWTGEFVDFAETAALMANLDVVISVDSSVVHCAGATGAPVWLLDRHDNCWRWGTDAARPGWYPRLRVFRQPAFGDWDAPLRDVAAALRTLPRRD